VIADQSYRDPLTGKCSMLGIFSYLRLADVPGTLPAMSVYCLLTGGRGTIPFSLNLLNSADDSESPLLSASGSITFMSPCDLKEVLIDFRQPSFPHAGEYRLQLRCAGDVVMERQIRVDCPKQARKGSDSH
jgi:hypothetical protein